MKINSHSIKVMCIHVLIMSHVFQSYAIYTPVMLAGFNADVVADIPGNASASTTADYDGVNYVYMSSTFNPSGPSYIPIGGIINSVVPTTPGLQFQLASYTGNNSLRLPGTSSGTLTFVTSQFAQTVFILGSTGSGIGTANITITFTDLTTQIFTGVTFPDWYGGPNFAIQGMGRTNRVTNIIYNNSIDPRLYQAPLALLPSNYGKLIQSVSFSNTGGVLNIMAISIDTPPIPCTGTPNAGTAIASSSNPCPGTTVNVNLSGSTAASNLAYQWYQGTNCNAPWVPISGLTNPSAITPTLSVSVVSGTVLGYFCKITCTSSGFSDSSTIACVVAQVWTCTSPCYLTSGATSALDQELLNVTMGSLNNTTDCINPLNGSQGNATGGNNMYANFTGAGGVASAVVYKGLSQSFSLTIGTCGLNIASSVKIFIDYNHNASCTDPGEEVYSNNFILSVLPSTIISGSFVVPASAQIGCTRMRVVMMSTSSGIISPNGTYPTGETEDYSVNIIQPSPYDPAITSINVASGNCFSNNENITATLCNYGSGTIDLSLNNVTVTLYVSGLAGMLAYPVIANVGILNPYGATCIPVVFSGVNLYAGGNYSINTNLVISGLSNGNLLNDSLNNAITRLNYRPIGGPSFQLCQGNIIPFGQGLTVSGCATPIQDSIEIVFTLTPGQPPICTSSLAVPTDACEFASVVLPALPAGSTFNADGILTVTNLASASLGCVTCVWPNEKRFSLFQGSAPPTAFNTFFPGTVGNNATNGANAQGYTYTNFINPSILGTIYATLGAGALLKMGSWNTFNTTANTHVINYNGNPTVAKLKIFYTYVPANYEWYKDSIGGPVLYTYSPFNPIGVAGSGILNSNTPGIYTFYAACVGSSACRIPVNLIIHPNPIVIQDSLTLCEYAAGSNSAIFNVSTLNGQVSAFAPSVSVSYFGDQALFLPVPYPLNDTSSTNFIYSKVSDILTGCYSSDSVYLDVNAIPQFISSPLVGNACAPNSIDVASLINPFTTTAGADTLYFEDPAYTLPYPNPHSIYNADTVYLLLMTNTFPACSDSATAIINITSASNYIANQDTSGNYSICGSVACANVILADGNTENLYSITDCRKIATVKDLTNGISLGSVNICEDIDCSVQFHQGQPYVNRHYAITPAINDSAEVCLYYLAQDFADYDATAFGTWPLMNPNSNLCITQVDQGDINTTGHTAISIPNAAITSTYDPLTTVWKVCFKVDSFSTFYCHTCNPLNIPLPISLLDFKGKKVGNTSRLTWTNGVAMNNSFFIVERSKDGIVFNQISKNICTKGLPGDSADQFNYFFDDENPLNGHNYYRLQQIDWDQKKNYSKIVDIFFGDETQIVIYPNPVNSLLNIEMISAIKDLVYIDLTDASGRVIVSEKSSIQPGDNLIKINTEAMSHGVYLCRIRNQKYELFSQLIYKK